MPLHDYDNDFRTAVEQMQDFKRLPRAPMAVVRMKSIQPFEKWARSMDHTDDRHYYLGIKALVNDGRLPRSALDNYESPAVAKLVGALGVDADALGFDAYVNALAKAIERGYDIPPLITVDGSPVDGRHRTLAALRLGRTQVPVMEITETFGADSKSQRIAR